MTAAELAMLRAQLQTMERAGKGNNAAAHALRALIKAATGGGRR